MQIWIIKSVAVLKEHYTIQNTVEPTFKSFIRSASNFLSEVIKMISQSLKKQLQKPPDTALQLTSHKR